MSLRIFSTVALALALSVCGVFAATLVPHTSHAESSSDVAAHRAQLQAELVQLEKDIAANQAVVDVLSAQGKSLSNEVSALNAQIKKAQLQIQATQVAIKQIDQNITVHTKTINILSGRLTVQQQGLAQILRQTDELDEASIVEVAFSAQDVSAFFGDLDSYVSLKGSLTTSYQQLTGTKAATEAQKQALEKQRAQQAELSKIQMLERQQVQAKQNEKANLLTVTKGQEAKFQQIVAAKQKTATQIRAELFGLAGGGGQIPLPTAIALAKQASAATGVSASLILGILKQETNLGQNVGQCLLTNAPNKGDGKGKNTGTAFSGVMKPERDVDPFMAITKNLGIDPYSQPVSCPPSYGYGGAMGPSQFIPSTWVLYQSRIASALGISENSVNPWNNLHAFTATAMLLADNGATAGTRNAERLAALRYFAGWGNASNPAYAFYGDGVMGFADQFKADIDTLSGS